MENTSIPRKLNQLPLSIPIVVTVGFIMGCLFLTGPILLLSVFFGILLLVLLYSKPEFGIIIIVAFTATFVYDFEFPLIPIGVARLEISDLLLLYLISVIFIRKIVDSNFEFERTPLDIPLILFYCCALIGLMISVLGKGLSLMQVLDQVRILGYYSVFFVVTNLVRDVKTLRTLVGSLFVISCLVAAGIILQSLTGGALPYLKGYSGSSAMYQDILRIAPPGVSLIFISLVAAFSIMLFSEKTWRERIFFIIFVLLSGGITLTFTRAYWIVSALCLLIAAGFAPLGKKLKVFVISVFCGIAVYAAIATYMPMRSVGVVVSERFKTLLSGSAEEIGTVDDRLTEYEYALEKIRSAPVFGIGLRSEYRPPFYGPEDELTYFVHNSYLWIIKDMGLVGLCIFLILMMRFLFRGFRKWRMIKDTYLSSIVLAYSISVLGLMVIALQSSTFVSNKYVCVYGLMMGINEVIYRLGYTKTENLDTLAS
jgi:O-antigen ligase